MNIASGSTNNAKPGHRVWFGLILNSSYETKQPGPFKIPAGAEYVLNLSPGFQEILVLKIHPTELVATGGGHDGLRRQQPGRTTSRGTCTLPLGNKYDQLSKSDWACQCLFQTRILQVHKEKRVRKREVKNFASIQVELAASRG
jgi:hypothetical protein